MGLRAVFRALVTTGATSAPADLALAAALTLALASVAGAGCGRGDPARADGNTAGGPRTEGEGPLTALRAFEAERRAKADFARMPPVTAMLGPDPYVVRRLPGTSRFVSILRGVDALVVLDASLREVERLPAPASPTGLAVTDAGEVLVSGELSSSIHRYEKKGDGLREAGALPLTGVRGIRDVAASPDGRAVYVIEDQDDRLITLLRGSAGDPPLERVDARACEGPMRVARVADFVIVDCLIDHSIIARRVDSRGAPATEGEVRIRHDGPIWCFDATPWDGGLLLAAGGVEDHPLDRREGSFGFIDSFVFLYSVRPGSEPPLTKLGEVNVSELRVITPKAIRIEEAASGAQDRGVVTVRVTGYGGDRAATLVFRGDLRSPPETSVSALPPGTTSVTEAPDAARVYSNTLLDAWVLDRGGSLTIVPAAGAGGAEPRARAEGIDPRKLGEALFFTSLMAPWNRTEGRLSRFTCETCHFEGYVDGRTHHTGRGDIRATTKPLVGLFNNRPRFSRALDPDLSTVSHSEFRVAGANSGHDSWFSVAPGDFPWLARPWAAPGPGARPIPPIELRKALMAFLMDFTHRPNQAAAGRSSFSAVERRGAEVFRDRCEACHSARLSADEPGSRAPFEQWERLVMAPEGALVWGRRDYKKTGILPYVHEEGARVPSLRRLSKKRPYFTNGSARTTAAVLERARFGEGEVFYHDGAPDGLAALNAADREALAAFLNLL